ncbi:hypothetical protein [Streptomyces canus]|uniref:hypothetical protein n=1 Tax=Streptomyces canus TaxID=58343 RepID=UPI0036E8FD3D
MDRAELQRPQSPVSGTARQLLWPRATRAAMGALAAPAGADAPQPAYGALVDRTADG